MQFPVLYRMILKKANIRCENFKRVMQAFLASVVTVFLFLPLLFKVGFIINFIHSTSIGIFVRLTALNILVLVLMWERAQRFWRRYKATKDTGKFPLIFLELFILYLIITGFLMFPFTDVSSSAEFKIFFGVNLLIWCSIRYHAKKDSREKVETNKRNELSDEPITEPEQDLLRREKLVNDLYNQIVNLPTGHTGSFTFGLYGRWGEGKTSVINLLTDKFENRENRENNKGFLVIRFDPWYFQDEKAILTSFYGQIEEAISDRFVFPDFRKVLLKYQKVISTGISLSGFSFDINVVEHSIEKIKQRIEKYIAQIDKRLLIIIDDIDRLQPDEITSVFKLIRKNANFRDTIFLLSFDPLIVKRCLKQTIAGESEYLEKIVNQPIRLPAIEKESIEKFLFNQIEMLLKELNIAPDEMQKFGKEFSILYNSDIAKLFITIRRAKRYVNALQSTLPSIKSEINLVDFFILEVIRVFNNGLYSNIWTNPTIYIQPDLKMMLSSRFDFSITDDEKPKIIKNHIEKVLGDDYPSVFKKLLVELFPDLVGKAFPDVLIGQSHGHLDEEQRRVEKCISHAECFAKYFTFLVPSMEISDEYIEAILDQWNSQKPDEQKASIFAELFEERENKRISKLMQKFSQFKEKIEPPLAKSFVEVIYKNADKFSKERMDPFQGSELMNANTLMLWLINDNVERGDIREVIEGVVTDTPDVYFSVLVIFAFRERQVGHFYKIYEAFDFNHLVGIGAKHLQEYFIEGKRDIFEIFDENEWFFILYHWATNWMASEREQNEIVSDYVLSLVKDDARKFSNFLLKFTEDDVFGGNDGFKKIQNIFKYKDFETVAKRFKRSRLLSDEEKNMIEKFLEELPASSPK